MTKEVLGESNADIIYDGTLANMGRALNDVEAALEKRGVRVAFVYRSPEKSAASAISHAISKGRPVPVWALAETHADAPVTVKDLAKKYDGDERVLISAVWNDGEKGTQRDMPIEEIPHVDQGKAEATFRAEVEAASNEGRASEAIRDAFLAPKGDARVEGKSPKELAERGRNSVTQDPAAGGVSASGDLNFGVESTADFDAADYRPSVVDWARERYGDMVLQPAPQSFRLARRGVQKLKRHATRCRQHGQPLPFYGCGKR